MQEIRDKLLSLTKQRRAIAFNRFVARYQGSERFHILKHRKTQQGLGMSLDESMAVTLSELCTKAEYADVIPKIVEDAIEEQALAAAAVKKERQAAREAIKGDGAKKPRWTDEELHAWRDLATHAKGKHANMRTEIYWCYQNIGTPVDDIDRDSVPSSGAVNHLKHIRSDDARIDSFYANMVPRIMPTKAELEEQQRLGDDGAEVESLLQELASEQDPVARIDAFSYEQLESFQDA